MTNFSLRTLLLLGFPLFTQAAPPPPDSIAVTFTLTDSVSAEGPQTGVAGSFNDWNPARMPFRRTAPNQLTATAHLPAGWYYYKFVTADRWAPDPLNPRRINDGGEGNNSILQVGTPPVPKRPLGKNGRLPRRRLPKPILDGYPEMVRLYYAAWEMAWAKIAHGTAANGFAASYLDEGFNELIYQWDTCFMTLFGLYGRAVLPALAALDNFYSKQREDGYIQRVYWETDGQPAHPPTADEPMINPPLFAWVEWRAFQHTADTARVRRVLPILVKHYQWLSANVRTPRGYYTTPLGSGMDNTPRPGVGPGGGWVDLTAQMALAARSISLLAPVAGQGRLAQGFREEHDRLVNQLNKLNWDAETNFYHDVRPDSSRAPTRHIGGFWPLLAGAADAPRAAALAGHVFNPATFGTPVPVPSLAATDPDFDPRGHYWRGGVWAPTTYMVAAGLRQVDRHQQAHEVAGRYLWALVQTFEAGIPSTDSVAYEQRFADGYHTLWEAYAPTRAAPATRWDNTFYTRQDFVGWTGLGPIAMLLEDLIGVDVDAPRRTVRWRLHEPTRLGVENLQVGNQAVSLLAEAALPDGSRVLRIRCRQPLTLAIESGPESPHQIFQLQPGRTRLTLRP